MAKTIIGMMGPGDGPTEMDLNNAEALGRAIANEGWVLLTGGRNVGVMDAASKGAQQAGGLVVGILPSSNNVGASEYLDIPICTGMGSARNTINILSSNVVVACGSGAGTTSEVMLALKAQKPLVLLNPADSLVNFIDTLPYPKPQTASSTDETVSIIKQLV